MFLDTASRQIFTQDPFTTNRDLEMHKYALDFFYRGVFFSKIQEIFHPS